MLKAKGNTMIEIEAKGLNRYTFVGYYDPIYHKEEDAPTIISIIGTDEEHAKERLNWLIGSAISRKYILDKVEKFE